MLKGVARSMKGKGLGLIPRRKRSKDLPLWLRVLALGVEEGTRELSPGMIKALDRELANPYDSREARPGGRRAASK